MKDKDGVQLRAELIKALKQIIKRRLQFREISQQALHEVAGNSSSFILYPSSFL